MLELVRGGRCGCDTALMESSRGKIVYFAKQWELVRLIAVFNLEL
jgi:hypothetical protein